MGAFSWDTETRPQLPNSPQEMSKQAADAVMRAYRDGKTRQSVRLRLDQLFDMDSLYLKGTEALLNATLPLAEDFARRIWGGEYLKKVRTSFIDDKVATLLYREAENEMQDVAALYLGGRELMLESKTQAFFSKMRDRLVVLVNTENAQDGFQVDYAGRDWPEVSSSGKAICKIFKEQSYYYYFGQFNQWQMTTFRTYPFPWEIYIEDLEYNTVRILESDTKPGYDELIAACQAYEEANKITPFKKIGKIFRDTQQQEEMSEQAEPGWRAQASGAEIEARARAAEEGRRKAEENAKAEKAENANA